MVKNISIDKMKQNSVMFPLPFPPSSSFLAQQCEGRAQISLPRGLVSSPAISLSLGFESITWGDRGTCLRLVRDETKHQAEGPAAPRLHL